MPEGLRNSNSALISIESPSRWSFIDLAELWRFRPLLRAMIWRDLVVRYKQTLLGVAWVVIQPLSLTLIYSVIFGHFAGLPSDGAPYPLFVFGGIVLWQFFARAVADASTSLVTQQGLISKIYYPRSIAPLTAIGSALVDFAVVAVFVLGAMLVLGVGPGARMFLAPIWVLAAVALAIGVSLWLTALDALYRDVRYLLGFVLQAWYFVTPVLYSPSLIPGGWRDLFMLNPIAPILQNFRWTILADTTPAPLWSVGVSAVVTLALLASGAAFFGRVERNIVDRL